MTRESSSRLSGEGNRTMRSGSGAAVKHLGIGLFLFFLAKGLVWLAVFVAAAVGALSL